MRVSPLLGKKRSPGFKRRVREGIQRTQEQGKSFGRPRERPILAAICETCGSRFTWTAGSSRHGAVRVAKTGRFCRKRCLVRWLHKHRQILPDAEVLRRLYWDEEMSLWAIAKLCGVTSHKTVSAALEKAEIPRRAKRHVGAKTCCEQGCNQLVYKIRHKTNGSFYGKRCKEHWNRHRNKLQKDYVDGNPVQQQRRKDYMKEYHERTRTAHR